jgi:cytochrome c553
VRCLPLAAFGALALGACTRHPPMTEWLYPPGVRSEPTGAAADALHRLPDSDQVFTGAQLADLQHAVDWRPGEHPPLPPAVGEGQGEAGACGYCHLPDGAGRPENAALAGLPAVYIRRQVAAFASGARGGASAFRPIQLMAKTAQGVDPGAVAAAADYFSGLTFTPRTRVVETDSLPPFKAQHFVYAFGAGAPVPLGERIIEGPQSQEGFALRDSHTTYVAYVPKGAIARGAVEAQGCIACHGQDLQGGAGPPIAGRSPTFIARQLFEFRGGAREEAEAQHMRGLTSNLTDSQIIDIAAYVGSLRP